MLTATNDIGATCQGRNFRKCSVIFKGGAKNKHSGRVRLSRIVNPHFVRTKGGKVLCYCDPLVAKDAGQAALFTELQDILMNSPLSGLTPLQRQVAQERADMQYIMERKAWSDANLGSGDEWRGRVALAIMRGYECNDDYFALRLGDDYPGFSEVGTDTFFYEPPCPTRHGLEIEEIFARHIEGNGYNAHTRLAWLKGHDGKERDEEILVIFDYLGCRDIFIPINEITKDMLPLAAEGDEGGDLYDEYGDDDDNGSDEFDDCDYEA